MDPERATRKAVLERIAHFEQAIVRARQYLESGEHAAWFGFRPLFVSKRRDGRELPPHKDWVRKFYLPVMERALHRSEMALDRLSREAPSRATDSANAAGKRRALVRRG